MSLLPAISSSEGEMMRKAGCTTAARPTSGPKPMPRQATSPLGEVRPQCWGDGRGHTDGRCSRGFHAEETLPSSLEMNPRRLQEVKSLVSCKSGNQDPSLWFQNLSHHGCPSIFAQNWEVKELKKPSATFFTLCLLHKT